MARNDSLGTAHVDIEPNFKNFGQGFQRAFAPIRDIARRFGRESGKDFSDAFTQEQDRGLSRAASGMERHGRSMAESVVRGYRSSGVSIGDEVIGDIDRAQPRAESSGRGLGAAIGRGMQSAFNPAVDQVMSRADTQFREYGDRAGRSFSDSLSMRLNHMLSKDFAQAAHKASSALTQFIGTSNLMGTALMGLINGIAGVAGGLFALVSAAGQAAGALAVLPGMLSALAQGGGALMLAFSGVGGAISEGFKAATTGAGAAAGATNSAGQQVAAAQKRVADAEKRRADVEVANQQRMADARKRLVDVQIAASDRLYDANKKVSESEYELRVAADEITAAKTRARQAEEALTDARRAGREELQQLAFSVESATLAEQRSAISLEKAYEQLQRVQNLPADDRSRREAELSYKEAELSYRQAKDRASDLAAEQSKAAKAGIEGTRAYTDARNEYSRAQQDVYEAEQRYAEKQISLDEARLDLQRQQRDAARDLADAEEAVRRARQQGQRDLQDANAALREARAAINDVGAAGGISAGGVDRFGEAMAKLSPSAQEFVKTLIGMKPRFDEFKKAVQQPFFEQINKQFKDTAHGLLNLLQPALERTSTILGTAGRSLLKTFDKPAHLEALGRVLQGNNSILEVFIGRNKSTGNVLQDLAVIALRVAEAIQPITRRFALWIREIVQGWRNITKGAEGMKRMTDFLDKAADRAAMLGRMGKIAWRIIKNLGSAADGAGVGLLDSMTEGLRNANKFLRENKAATKEWFDTAADSLRGVANLAKIFLGAFGRTEQLKAFNDSMGVLNDGRLKDAVYKIADAFAAAGPKLAELVVSLVEMVAVLTNSGAIERFMDVLNIIVDVLSKILQNPFVAWFVGIVSGFTAVTRAISFALVPLSFFFKAISGGVLKALHMVSRLGAGFKGLKNIGKGGFFKDFFGKVDGKVREEIQIKEDKKKGITQGDRLIERSIDQLRATVARGNATDGGVDGRSTGKSTTSTTTRRGGTAVAGNFDDSRINVNLEKIRAAILRCCPGGAGGGTATKRAPTTASGGGLGDDTRVLVALKEIKTAILRCCAMGAMGGAPVGGKGGKGGPAGGGVDGRAAGKADNAASSAVSKVGNAADDAGGKAAKSAGRFGKLGTVFKNIGGVVSKVLGPGMRVLGVAFRFLLGPIGMILMFLPDLVFLFKDLYENNEKFRTAIDNLLAALKPFWDALQTMVQPVVQSLSETFADIKTTIGEVALELSNTLVPVFEAVAPVFQTIAGVVGPVLGGAFKVLGTIIGIIVKLLGGALVGAFKMLAPLLQGVAKLWQTIFGALGENFKKFVALFKTVWNDVLKPAIGNIGEKFETVKQIVINVWERVREKWNGFVETFKTIWNDKLKPFLSELGDKLKAPFTAFANFVTKTLPEKLGSGIEAIKELFRNAVSKIGEIWGTIGEKIKGPLGEAFKWINNNVIEKVESVARGFPGGGGISLPRLPQFATGGHVRGPGSGTSDSILARVSNGEFIVKASKAKKYRKLLELLNSGQEDSILGGPWWEDIGSGIADKFSGGVDWLKEKAGQGLGMLLEGIIVPALSLVPGLDKVGFLADGIKGGLRSLADNAKRWGTKTQEIQEAKYDVWVHPMAKSPSGKTSPWDNSSKNWHQFRQYYNGGAGGHHQGEDIGAPSGSPLRAVTRAKVLEAGNAGDARGNYVVLAADFNGARYLFKYFHMVSRPLVRAGSTVSAGELIGRVGNTGRSYGAHLHFEAWKGADNINPNAFLAARNVRLAQGGYVYPTPGGLHAVIGEAGKTERVEPLDSRGLSKRDKDIVDRLDKIMNGGGAVQQVRVYIGDQELKGIVKTEIVQNNRVIARKVAQGRKHSAY